MFTGIVEEIGHIKSVNQGSIEISCKKILEDIHIGDSIAIDGVCLTVTSFSSVGFSADVSFETKKVTNIGKLVCGDLVNLERAMLVNSRFGGHIVSGHVDCVATVSSIVKNKEFYTLEIKLPSSKFSQYFVKKGSITIDGISLTIANLTDTNVTLAIIPHTFENTNMNTFEIGTSVNIEFDILGKYVEKILLMNDNKNNITEDFLKDNGFM